MGSAGLGPQDVARPVVVGLHALRHGDLPHLVPPLGNHVTNLVRGAVRPGAMGMRDVMRRDGDTLEAVGDGICGSRRGVKSDDGRQGEQRDKA